MGASDKGSFILGSSAFIEEYVRTRQIPIPKLLQAFGVDLVFRYELSRAKLCWRDPYPPQPVSGTPRSTSNNNDIFSSGRNDTSVGWYFSCCLTSLTIFASIRQRDRLPEYNSIPKAIELIKKSQRILILTGAGISMFSHFRFSLLFIFDHSL